MATAKTETRNFAVRAAAGDDFCLEGYAALFNSESKDLGGFTETIAPGAFDRSLAAKSEVKFTFNHSLNKMLARTKNNSLVLSTDDRGLKFRAQLDKGSPLHVEIYRAVKSGLLDECSFAFCVAPNGQVWNADATKRTLTDVDLLDAAVVSNPAYEGTSVDARSLAAETQAFVAKILALPEQWARDERIHQANLSVLASRSDTADSEPDEEEDFEADQEMQDALDKRFGRTRCGFASAHFLLSKTDERCYTRHLDSDSTCSIPYSEDDDGYTFGDPEPCPGYGTGERAAARLAQAAVVKSDLALRQRMATAAGRGRP